MDQIVKCFHKRLFTQFYFFKNQSNLFSDVFVPKNIYKMMISIFSLILQP